MEGRVGVAPTNASFQTFVTALRLQKGEDEARTWLEDFAANDPQRREKNGEILADVDAGTLDTGLVNHYYLFELAREKGVAPEELGASLHFFPDGDLGSLVNVSGMGLVASRRTATPPPSWSTFLSEDGPVVLRRGDRRYPLVEAWSSRPASRGSPRSRPHVDLNDLDDLQTTIQMIQEAGLL
ncbi:ABC transporter substrate-binding protein [Micrococcus luteus]